MTVKESKAMDSALWEVFRYTFHGTIMVRKSILDIVTWLLIFYFVKCKESEKSLSSDSTIV